MTPDTADDRARAIVEALKGSWTHKEVWMVADAIREAEDAALEAAAQLAESIALQCCDCRTDRGFVVRGIRALAPKSEDPPA